MVDDDEVGGLSMTYSGCDEWAATRADSARIQGHLFIHGHTTEYTVGGGGWEGHIKGKKKRKNERKGDNTNQIIKKSKENNQNN